jgi:hypothetical protein
LIEPSPAQQIPAELAEAFRDSVGLFCEWCPRRRVPRKAKAATPPRQWRAALIRKHGQVLGYVEARTRAAAELAAAAEFNLTAEQRKRLVVQEWG